MQLLIRSDTKSSFGCLSSSCHSKVIQNPTLVALPPHSELIQIRTQHAKQFKTFLTKTNRWKTRRTTTGCYSVNCWKSLFLHIFSREQGEAHCHNGPLSIKVGVGGGCVFEITPGLLFKRQLLIDIGLFDENYKKYNITF